MANIFKEIKEKAVYQSVWQNNNLHILQSWNWGITKEIEGWKILRLGLFHAEDAVIPTEVISLQIKKIPLINSKIAYLPKLSSQLLLAADNLNLLSSYLLKQKIAFVIYEFDKNIDNAGIPSSLAVYNGHIQPQQTNQVSLAKSEEDLFMGLDGKYRRNIKKSLREDVTISQYQYSSGENSSLPIAAFYKIMQSIFANTKFMERDFSYFQAIWNTLGADDQARVFLAEHKLEKGTTEVVGAYLVINDNRGAYELYGGVNKTGRDLEAGYLLKWQAISYFNQHGLQYYDHWGVAPRFENGEYDTKDELYQISRFKAGFGGDYLKFPKARVQIFSKSAYKIFLIGKKASTLRLKFKKLLKS